MIMELLMDTIRTVLTSVGHNWLPLGLAICTAAAMKVYIDTAKMQRFLMGQKAVPVLASVAVGAVTPLCACGTMAVVLGLLTTTLPWAPVMAFLTSSPLMSPDGFIMIAGIVGVGFAVALLVSSIVIGLGSGLITGWIERNTDWLKDQSRFSGDRKAVAACGCGGGAASVAVFHEAGYGSGEKADFTAFPKNTACGCGSPSAACCAPTAAVPSFLARTKLDKFAKEFVDTGIKQILLFYMLFVALGYMIQRFVPQEWIMSLFSADTPFAIPLAAAIGLPLYVAGDAAVPLIKALMSAGAGGGAMLAFMITGPATSAWVIAGIATFMKRRAIALYLAFIVAGGVGMGYLYEFALRVLR